MVPKRELAKRHGPEVATVESLVRMREEVEQRIREMAVARGEIIDEAYVDLWASEYIRSVMEWAMSPRWDHETDSWSPPPELVLGDWVGE